MRAHSFKGTIINEIGFVLDSLHLLYMSGLYQVRIFDRYLLSIVRYPIKVLLYRSC